MSMIPVARTPVDTVTNTNIYCGYVDLSWILKQVDIVDFIEVPLFAAFRSLKDTKLFF